LEAFTGVILWNLAYVGFEVCEEADTVGKAGLFGRPVAQQQIINREHNATPSVFIPLGS
jgi:hypothetical protein